MKTTDKIEDIKFYTLSEVEDRLIGEIGTPQRDEYEEELRQYALGEQLKQARISKNISQEELGEAMGIQKARVSKIEHGKNLTFNTVIRYLKALGIPANLEIGDLGKVALY